MPIHVEGKPEDLAKIVLLPGDPERAKYIAENFLDKPKLYTDYRLMFGYTGTYKGYPVSVQTTGMGTPSLSIVVEELHMLGVKTFIRVGTSGVIQDNIDLGDVIIANAAHSSHDIFSQRFNQACFSSVPDFLLTKYLYEKSVENKIHTHIGPILTSETFYEETMDLYKKFASYGTLSVEMEAYALFGISSKYKTKSACVLTASDNVFAQKRADKAIIKNGVDKMIAIVLDSIAEHYDYLS